MYLSIVELLGKNMENIIVTHELSKSKWKVGERKADLKRKSQSQPFIC
jgi:hypothetical protein